MSRREPPAAEKQLEKAAEQVQTQLKSAVHTAELDALAAYFTLCDPPVRGVPFCVALARSTFLFHLQMERVPEADAELYVSLISKVCSLLQSDKHPFVEIVLAEDLFGLGTAFGHCVVRLPVYQYGAISYLTAELAIREAVPETIIISWRLRLEHFTVVRSPLVSLRSQMLLVKTSTHTDHVRDLAELQRIIQSRPTKMNVDLILLCYERLKRLVPDPLQGTTHGRALSILSSDIFLKLRSPIRRHYVEHYLYPSLVSSDTHHFLDNDRTRRHMAILLLRQCTPGMQPGSPYYMCLCAIIQKDLVEELSGAMELVSLMEYQMPQASYFISALAIDPHMSQQVFVKIIMLLNRGAAHVMTQRGGPVDPIVAVVNNRTTMVYNILFCLRDIVRQCVSTDSKRANELLEELQTAISTATVQALGTFSSAVFDGHCDVSIEPQLLCAELGMLLHSTGVDAAVDASIEHFKNAATRCVYCGNLKGSSLVCHANGTVHLSDRAAFSRVLSTISDCACNRSVQNKISSLLREDATQLLSATHFFLYHILAHAGHHRTSLLTFLEPYIRSMLVKIADGDANNSVSSEARTSVLFLHSRIVSMFPQDPLQFQSMLKIMSALQIRCEHDSLALFWFANRMLRIGRGNVELLPLDPHETHYGQSVPGTAPTSYAAADNAQILLRILFSSHAFNENMRRLLGCSVCKLIQDFNVQAANIVSSLLDPLGLLPNVVASATTFGFPCSPASVFWDFIIRQMKRSAPARTAFITTLVRCISTRFANSSPLSAVTQNNIDPSSHLFSIVFFQSMRRHAHLARIVSYMLSGWLSMEGNSPEKLVCLLYACSQVALALKQSDQNDMIASSVDIELINESIDECVTAIRNILPHARTLLSVSHNSLAFQHLFKKIIHSAALVSGETTSSVEGTYVTNPTDDTFFGDFDGEAYSKNNTWNSAADDHFSNNDHLIGAQRFEAEPHQNFRNDEFSVNSTTSQGDVLDTLVSTGSQSDFTGSDNTVVKADLDFVDTHPPVEMPLPSLTHDESSQTSPTTLGAQSSGLEEGECYVVPSDVVFDYLMKNQSRASTLEDLRIVQFAGNPGANDYSSGDQFSTRRIEITLPIAEPNSYSEPHQEQQSNPTSLLTSTLQAFHEYDPKSFPSMKRPREPLGESFHTPNHDPHFNWESAGVESARNELRMVMSDLGLESPSEVAKPNQSQPSLHAVFPQNYEHHQQLTASYQISNSCPDLFSQPKVNQPVLHTGFVDQHSEVALREVRQAMGVANPNIHPFNGRAKQKSLNSNEIYTFSHQHI